MEQVISATQARIHFGELIQKVASEQSPIIVERGGKAQVVIISVNQYEQLKRLREQQKDWRELVKQARAQIAAELGDRKLVPVEEIIEEMREERDAQLLDLR